MTQPAPPSYRYPAATLLAAVIALYVTTFARQTHNTYDLPTWIDITEWPATLLFLAAAWAAWNRVPRRAAFMMVTGLIAFVAVQFRHLLDVPLGFAVVTALCLAFLFTLPPVWNR